MKRKSNDNMIRFVAKFPVIFKKSTPKRVQNEYLGHVSELITKLYLWCCGYSIIKSRYKNPFGEIDIIAKRGGSVVFTEVKYRHNLDDGLSCLSLYQQKRITNGAKHFLYKHPHYAHFQMRFDVFVLSSKGMKRLKNAWID